MHDTNSSNSSTAQQAAIFAQRLLDFYPAQDMGNPEVVLSGIILLFREYPRSVVERAVSPIYGLPKIHKFMPRISEIAEFLEAEMKPIRREEERRNRVLLLPAPSIDRSKRKTYAELQEMCARDGLLIGRKKPENRERYAREFRAKNDVPDAVWDSIPDAPVRGWKQMGGI